MGEKGPEKPIPPRVPPASPRKPPEPPTRKKLDMGPPPPKLETEPINEPESPGPSVGPGDIPQIGPGGEVHVPIPEVKYLKFRITKLEEENIKLQEAKISSDETILRMSKMNLSMMKEAFAKRTSETYKEIGVGDGDKVIQRGDGFFIVKEVRGMGLNPSGVRK